MSVRAKFRVNSVEESQWSSGKNVFTVKANPVTFGRTEENKAFYEATPGGSIQLSVVNAEIAKRFPVGSEFYVDFTPA